MKTRMMMRTSTKMMRMKRAITTSDGYLKIKLITYKLIPLITNRTIHSKSILKAFFTFSIFMGFWGFGARPEQRPCPSLGTPPRASPLDPPLHSQP